MHLQICKIVPTLCFLAYSISLQCLGPSCLWQCFHNAQTLIFACFFFLRAVQTISATYVFPELILSFYHHPLNIYFSPPNILYLHISNFIHRFSMYVAEEIINGNIQRNKGRNSSGIMSFC